MSENHENLPLLLDVPAACRALSIGKSTLWTLIGRGALETTRIGRRTLIRAESVRRLAAEGCEITPAA